MFGIAWWLSISVLLTLASLGWVVWGQRGMPWLRRGLLGLGLVALILATVPATLGPIFGTGHSPVGGGPILFLAAVVAFGSIAISDAVASLDRR